MELYKAATMPVDFTTATIGGAISATQITGAVIGEVHFSMAATDTGGGDQVQHSKFFAYNEAATDAEQVRIWVRNACDQLSTDAAPKGVGASASDNVTKKIRWMGYETITGNALQVEQTLNGTTEITCPSIFQSIHRAEIRLVAGGALTALAGDYTLKQGSTVLGIIPEGFSTATFEYDLGLATTINDSGTTADAATAPAGVIFSRPRDYASGLVVAGGGTLTPGDAQGVWSRWTLPERAKPSADIYYIVRTRVLAASV